MPTPVQVWYWDIWLRLIKRKFFCSGRAYFTVLPSLLETIKIWQFGLSQVPILQPTIKICPHLLSLLVKSRNSKTQICLLSESQSTVFLLLPGSNRCFAPRSEYKIFSCCWGIVGCVQSLISEGVAAGCKGCSHLMRWLCLKAEAAGFRPAPCRIMNCHASADYLTSLYNV